MKLITSPTKSGDSSAVATLRVLVVIVLFQCLSLPIQATGTMDFADGFEGASLDSFWTQTANAGSIAFPSTTQVHNGRQAVRFNSIAGAGQKQIELSHSFARPQYGRASVWVYDTGADRSSGNYLGLWVNNRRRNVYSAVLVYDYNSGDGATYRYGAWGVGGASSIRRTVAWHHFEIVATPDALQLSVDGQVVYFGPGGIPFDYVGIYMSGPSFRPAMTSYFDDFEMSLMPSLGPAVSIRCSQCEVCWDSITNRSYQVQYQSSLTTNIWIDWGTPITGDGSQKCLLDSIATGQPQRFYRVLELP